MALKIYCIYLKYFKISQYSLSHQFHQTNLVFFKHHYSWTKNNYLEQVFPLIAIVPHIIYQFSSIKLINLLLLIQQRMNLKKASPLITALFSTEKVNTVPGHKAPSIADTAAGRYAGSLFTAASKSEALQTILKDMTHLGKVIEAQQSFKEFLKNSAIKRSQQKEVISAFADKNYHELTLNMLESVIEAGRLADLEKIVSTYISYCKILNKEEDIKIISAKELTNEEKEQVVAAYQQNKPDTKFKVTYEVDASILGGLQIFAGSSFLDCSLRSRLEKLKTEVSKIA